MFKDRIEAARLLADKLASYKDKKAVVLALPRGGAVLGAAVAKKLNLPLGLVLVRKIGHPYSPEYAIGAVAEGHKPIFNEGEASSMDGDWLKQAVSLARQLIQQRRELYYGEDFIPPDIADQVVILIDDGIATGLTMEAAVLAVRKEGAKSVIVAVPVASSDSAANLRQLADKVLVLEPPESFMGAVGSHYRQFDQVDDDEVRALLRQSQR